ncbi:MAG: dihydroorotase family protein [Acidimicrobiia bacterium]|nr:dihydroorotase family protein [Acidimicrobiia bacterium]MDH4305978.1 dihydroorotase family protein [Acidimicrobiia bacterium]
MKTCVVRNARVVTPTGLVEGDVVVENGRFARIGGDRADLPEVAAGGLVMMPGGVDTHVHLMDPGPTEREDFPTGTRAAAARGVTTIIEHTHAHPIREVADLAEKRSHLTGRSNVDFALAAHVWPDRISQIPGLWDAGVAFFKIFTCTTHGVPGIDPGHLHAALAAVADRDARALIHCEDESMTAEAERLLRAEGRADPGILTEWRNREAELVAIAAASVIARATRAAVTFAHVSSAEVIEVVAAARRWGADIAAEACPQYFALEEAEVLAEGPLRKFTPPARIRDEADRNEMWEAVRSGAFSHFSTDHAPSTMEQKSHGDMWEAPFGLPGLDTTYPFLIDAALTGVIDLTTAARLYSQAPAERYGLATRKGAIRVGADADFVLIDPEQNWTVANGDIISKAGWSPYAGRTFKGRIVATYLRGEEIARDGHAHDTRSGMFLPGMGGRGY